MEEKEFAELLYTDTTMRTEVCYIDAWFDCDTGEKHVDLVEYETRHETNIIANNMTPVELGEKINAIIEKMKK